MRLVLTCHSHISSIFKVYSTSFCYLTCFEWSYDNSHAILCFTALFIWTKTILYYTLQKYSKTLHETTSQITTARHKRKIDKICSISILLCFLSLTKMSNSTFITVLWYLKIIIIHTTKYLISTKDQIFSMFLSSTQWTKINIGALYLNM